MYELIQAAPNSYYIDCPARMGLCRLQENQMLLIDSGNDKEAGKKVLKLLDANGWTLGAILNTHSNADHIGGNRLLLDRTGCFAYAPGVERAFTESPVLEPSFLYGGFPPKALRNKFLMAQSSPCAALDSLVLPDGFEIFPLPGHFFDMVGVRSPDQVCYLADCLNGAHILEKYHIGFIYDVAAYLDTLDFVEHLEAACFVPAHAPVTADIRPLVALNRAKVFEIAELLCALCAEPIGFDALLRQVFDHYGLVMDFDQYVLVGSTLRSYLAWLLDTGRLACDFLQNRMVWRRI